MSVAPSSSPGAAAGMSTGGGETHGREKSGSKDSAGKSNSNASPAKRLSGFFAKLNPASSSSSSSSSSTSRPQPPTATAQAPVQAQGQAQEARAASASAAPERAPERVPEHERVHSADAAADASAAGRAPHASAALAGRSAQRASTADGAPPSEAEEESEEESDEDGESVTGSDSESDADLASDSSSTYAHGAGYRYGSGTAHADADFDADGDGEADGDADGDADGSEAVVDADTAALQRRLSRLSGALAAAAVEAQRQEEEGQRQREGRGAQGLGSGGEEGEENDPDQDGRHAAAAAARDAGVPPYPGRGPLSPLDVARSAASPDADAEPEPGTPGTPAPEQHIPGALERSRSASLTRSGGSGGGGADGARARASSSSTAASGGASVSSLASGKASRSLNAPLLQLEEIELRAFLRNFSKHTRQVHAPRARFAPPPRHGVGAGKGGEEGEEKGEKGAHAPGGGGGGAMPQWSDFRVRKEDDERARRLGKRAGTLAHVDEGLRRAALRQGGAAAAAAASMEGDALREKDAKRREKEKSKEGSGAKKGKKEKDKDKDKASSASGSKDAAGAGASSSGAGASAEPLRLHDLPPPPAAAFGSASGSASSPRIVASPLPVAGDGAGAGAGVGDADAGRAGTGTGERERSGEEGQGGAAERQDEPPRSPLSDDWSVVTLPASAGGREVEVDSYADEEVDGVAFIIAYILALVERYAPGELDDAPSAPYSESKSRSHLARLYVIAPFWERLLRGTRKLYRWEEPRRTAAAAMIYFCLWYSDLIPTAFCLTLIFYVCQFRFFPPEVSRIAEQVKERMRRGAEAERINQRLRRQSRLDILNLYKRWIDTFGVPTQVALGDIADGHEKIKSLILWRNPTATWRTVGLLSLLTLIVTFAPPQLVLKGLFFFLGIVFFVLLPLQSHYPRYRRPLSPIWWALWGCPTDAQFAMHVLRRRKLAELELQTSASKLKNAVYASGRLDGLDDELAGEVGHGPLSEAINGPIAEQIAALEGSKKRKKKKGGSKDGSQAPAKPKARKVGSFFCQHRGVPGFLHVTTEGIYFVGVHSHVGPGQSHKICKTPFTEITDLIKTKSIKLFVWNSSGLQIKRVNGRSHFFSNMNHRDKAFNLILALGSEVWSKL